MYQLYHGAFAAQCGSVLLKWCTTLLSQTQTGGRTDRRCCIIKRIISPALRWIMSVLWVWSGEIDHLLGHESGTQHASV